MPLCPSCNIRVSFCIGRCECLKTFNPSRGRLVRVSRIGLCVFFARRARARSARAVCLCVALFVVIIRSTS